MAQPAAIADKTAATLTLFQAKMLVIGLKFELKSGLKMSGKVNSKRIAAQALGLPTRTKTEVLIESLENVIQKTEKIVEMKKEIQKILQEQMA